MESKLPKVSQRQLEKAMIFKQEDRPKDGSCSSISEKSKEFILKSSNHEKRKYFKVLLLFLT